MELYLIRHGDALPLEANPELGDAARPLTPEGREQSRSLASALQKLGVQLDILLSSPLVRSRQTAEEMLQTWSPAAIELSLCEELAPGGKRRKLSRFLEQLGSQRIGMVGHQPDLGAYAGWLIGSRKARIELSKGGIACLRCPDGPDKGGGTLNWLLTPKWLCSKD